jgi:hypothetical protein
LDFINTLLILTGTAAGVALVVYGLVYAGSSRGNKKRYRPGRPFEFTPVWFVSAPERQARAGISASRELAQVEAPAPARPARPRETGGASDRW